MYYISVAVHLNPRGYIIIIRNVNCRNEILIHFNTLFCTFRVRSHHEFAAEKPTYGGQYYKIISIVGNLITSVFKGRI